MNLVVSRSLGFLDFPLCGGMYFGSLVIGSPSSTSISSMPPLSSFSYKSRGSCGCCVLSIFHFLRISVGMFHGDCLTETYCGLFFFLWGAEGLVRGYLGNETLVGTSDGTLVEGMTSEGGTCVMGGVVVIFSRNSLRKSLVMLANPSLQKSFSKSSSDIQLSSWHNTRKKNLMSILRMQCVIIWGDMPCL